MIRNMWFRLRGKITFVTILFLTCSACFVSGLRAQTSAVVKVQSPQSTTMPLSFGVAPSMRLTYAPTSEAIGDLNRDGKPDLITADRVSGVVTVYLGVGDGTFAPGVSYAAGPAPNAIAIADVDGDGSLDVIVSSASEGTVSVLLGNGNGTLQARKSYAVGFAPALLATGDFNGDGKTDVVVAGNSGTSLALLLNDGNGGFAAPKSYSLAKAPTALAVADFNADGHADVVLANGDGTVSVLLGDGAGAFRPVPDVSVAAGALSSIVIGDFNRDGNVDLAVTQSGAKQVSVLLGKGDGTFGAAASYAVGNAPASSVVTDVDGDGIPDLVVTNRASNTLSVLHGNGDGTFKSSVDFVVGNGPLAAVAGDFNGDGHADLATINYASQSVSIALGNGDGTFKASRSYSAEQAPRAIASGDLNGDKLPDLVVANYCGSDSACLKAGSVTVFLGKTGGGYQPATTYPVGSGPVAVSLVDVNGDKILDLVALNRNDKTATVMLGAGDGTFGQANTFALAGAPVALGVGDFNKDGKPDLAIVEDCGSASCTQPGNVEIMLGSGAGAFASSSIHAVGYSPSGIAVGNLTRNTYSDIVVANRCGKDATCQSGGTASLLMNDGTGRFTSGTDVALGTSPASIALANLHSSTVLDLVASQSTSKAVSVLVGNGDGTFKTAVPYAVGNGPASLAIGDFNGDGIQDVAVTNVTDSTVSVLLGNGDGTLQTASALPVGGGPSALTAVSSPTGGATSLATANGSVTSPTAGTDVTALVTATPMATGTGAATVTLTAPSLSTTTVLDSVALAVAVTSTSGTGTTPAGQVVFNSNGTPLSDCGGATGETLSGGTFTCNTKDLTAGTDALTVAYSGDSHYAAGTSNSVNQTVNAYAATLALSASPSSTTGVNVAVTFTAQLQTSGSGTIPFSDVKPLGTVAFTANGTGIANCSAQAVNASGAATCTTSALAIGTDPITATYSGDTNYTVASAASANQTVTPYAATLTVTGNPSPSQVNVPVTFTAALTGTGIAFTPVAPTGTVTWLINGASSTDCPPVTVNSTTGKATCTTAALPLSATNTVSASYSGDTNFTVASSGTATQAVTAFAATLNVSGSPNPSQVNGSVTFTAQLAGTGIAFTPVAPSGNVAFTANGNQITGCTAQPVNASGTATCTTTSLPKGTSEPITASYSGDTNFTVATAGTTTQTVNAFAATLSLSGSPSPSTVNQQVTFTATLTGTGISFTPTAPSGNVNFKENGTTITNCNAVMVSATGVATCATSALPLGASNNITASYSGDTNFTVATAGTATQAVTATAPTVTVTTSPTTSTVNQSVTISAALTGVSLTPIAPSGHMAFSVGGNSISNCTSQAVNASTGIATCTTTALPLGTDTISATYSGDTNFVAASPGTGSQTVTAFPATLTLTASPSSSVSVGTSVTFTASLGGTGISFTPTAPTGTVTFTINGNPSSDCPAVKVNGSTGKATCTTASLVAPADVIGATYSGDANFTVANPASFTESVGTVAAQTALVSVPTSPAVNQAVVLTATVKPPSGSTTTLVPTGSVTFTQGTTTLCSAVTLSAGVANCSYAFTSAVASPGTTVTATYSGDSNFGAGTPATRNIIVVAAGTTTSVVSTPDPSSVNVAVTINATVTSNYTAGNALPTGTVVIKNASSGTTLCTETISSGVVPTCTYTFTASGNFDIVATYTSGDSNFTGSVSPGTGDVQAVGSGSTSVVLTSVPTTSTVNQQVTFSAGIKTLSTGTVYPQGTVTYTDTLTSKTLCTVNVSSTGTVPDCTAALLIAGTHTITAAFATSDANFNSGTSNVLNQFVGPTATTTTVVANPASSSVNQNVTFTATVTPAIAPFTGSTAPTGSVTFTSTLNSQTAVLCTTASPVSTTNSITTATCTAPLPASGTYSISATYSGDTNFQGGTSTPITQPVGIPSTTVTLSANPATASVNQTVTFSVALTPQFTGTTKPGGTVTYTDTSNSTQMCSVTVNAGLAPNCAYAFATAGTHTVTASYSGDSNFASGTSSVLSETITAGKNSLALVSSLPTSLATQTVTFTASITPDNKGQTAPSGNVSFSFSDPTVISCGSVPLVNNGNGISTAVCNVTFTSTEGGAITVTANYAGDSNFSASSYTITQTVQNFGIAFSPTGPLNVTQGYSNVTDPFNSTALSVVLSPVGGFTDALVLNCVVTNTTTLQVVSDPSCVQSGTTANGYNYTINASPTAPVGQYSVALTATDSTDPALLHTAAPLAVYTVGVAGSLSLAPGAVGTGNVVFNTAPPLTGTPAVTLNTFACGTIYNVGTGAVDATINNEVTCTGPSGGVTVTGFETTVPITITTQAPTYGMLLPEGGSSSVSLASLFGIPLLALLGWVGSRKSPRRNFIRFIGLILLMVGVSYTTGCGGSFTRPPPPTGGIAPGSYLIQVVATDSTQANSAKYYAVVPLVVN